MNRSLNHGILWTSNIFYKEATRRRRKGSRSDREGEGTLRVQKKWEELACIRDISYEN